MFNQTENMIARSEYQQMQQSGARFVEGVAVSGQRRLRCWLLSELTNRKPAKKDKAPVQQYQPGVLQPKH